jgi:hypothetical protein
MERCKHLALLVTRIYGMTFLALSFGWGLAGLTMLFWLPGWQRSADGYFFTALAHLMAGGLIIGFSHPIARFAARPNNG